MNIIITTTIYPPDIGGPAVYAYEVMNRLKEKGHKIQIITTSQSVMNESSVYVIKKKMQIRFIGFIFHNIQILLFLLIKSKDFNVDVIYTFNPNYLGLVSIISSYILRKPVVLRLGGDGVWESAFNQNITDKNPEIYFKNFEGGLNLKFIFYLQSLVLRLAKIIIVPSESIRDILIEFYKIKPEKIKVIYNSVEVRNTNFFKESQNLNIISVGRLIKLKRVDMLIKVVNDLHDRYPNIKLFIAGDGPEKNNLEKLSSKIRAKEFVTFLGNLNREKINHLYLNSDILVLNSLYEVFPHVLIEAMNYRVPVITSSKGGAMEIVEDEHTGLIVASGTTEELKEKLTILIENKQFGYYLAENAYNCIKCNFTWKKNLQKLEKELNDLI